MIGVKILKSIIDKIKATVKLIFRKWKKEDSTEYIDLAPADKIENGSEYFNALHWALNNKKVKNIALAGPYGSGKSSIIETYLNQHNHVKKKTLRISMATFTENAIDGNGNLQKVDITQEEIELGILKQLFYKVDYKKIPQSRYRKLHKIGWKGIWGYLTGISVIISIMAYIFFPVTFNSTVEKIITAGSLISLSLELSLLLFGVLILGILAIIAIIYRSIASRFRLKEIKLPADTAVNSGEESNETVFDKYMDEIVYFFEETEYRIVFFEDLDRLENSSIFVHLRELNTLLNNYNVIKEPIVFVYAVKDDIFSDLDRTKFFEFIIPVIPIINSTNSGEILLEKLDTSTKLGIQHEISQSFVLDVSPYISDMRILLNTYNEFIVYKKTLRIEQDLKLLDEPMMALIIFKNLYPRDFADIQMEHGIIKHAFSDKQQRLKTKQDTIQSEIDALTNLLDEIPLEALKSIRELKSVFLCEITDWQGCAYDIRPSEHANIRATQFMDDTFDVSQWGNANQCSGNHHSWNGNSSSFSCTNFVTICASYLEREKRVRVIEENRIAETQRIIEKLKLELHDISGWSLKRLIEQFGSEEILSSEVQQNKLLVFLLRRGYIDEKYASYINYFKGNTVTKEDMNFILSVKNMESQPFNYNLTKTSMVVRRLQDYEFKQKSIYNFNLLEYMLSSSDSAEKLNVLMKQLSNGDEQSWKFIDEFIDLTEYQSHFIKLLASIWQGIWDYIANNIVLTYERKIHYLTLLIENVDTETFVAMNTNNKVCDFFEQHEDIFQQLATVSSSKVIDVIKVAQVTFIEVTTENVPADVLDYIFDNNCYKLNFSMLQKIVEYKNKDFIPDLATKHYTTIIALNYAPLTNYVRENLTHYLETIVLVGESASDEEPQILDLLARSIDNYELCIRIIKHEDFRMEDITLCCKKLMATNKTAVNSIWDTLLENDKIFVTWENIHRYWAAFEFTDSLRTYIEKHVDDLVESDSQCVDDDFIRKFIDAELTVAAFEVLLPHIRMENFDIALSSVTENKVSTMINCHYFEFTIAHYEEISGSFPNLCIEFILQNQTEYINAMDSIQMDSALIENLLFSKEIDTITAQTLIDNFGAQNMTVKIADNLCRMGFTISDEIFKAAWGCLDELGKQKLMLENLELLDAESLHSCFVTLEKYYSNFIDRSKRRVVELAKTQENKRLAERLQAVEYITSHELNERREFDSITDAEKVTIVISCRIKAVK